MSNNFSDPSKNNNNNNQDKKKKYLDFVVKRGTSDNEIEYNAVDVTLFKITQGYDTFVSFIMDIIIGAFDNITDFSDIPEKFDYGYITVAYFWSFIITSAKEIGHSIGKCSIGSYLMSSIFGLPATALITYLLLPLRLFLIKRISDNNFMTIAERRLDLILNAFIFGICVENVINYLELTISDGSVTYYLPIVLVSSITIIGPRLGRNRTKFIIVIMGIGLCVSLILTSIFSKINTEYFLGLLLDIIFSFFNIQFLIANLRKPKDERDMTSSQTMSLILSLYTHLCITFLTGRYIFESAVDKIVGKQKL
ncbi:Hypothetical protein SRAE_1000217300 [Strongyloides ratti]|uniref:Uncharacterized protein n=1 Tax=Strongyloides ratti TaxID=34506 RepID=A0A090L2J1_STRRB|nr:Hypothetical protein SRAE_1000217300 [Strongyloides ratti]CEF63917.1 Hypothetical protein SRAE_1000217300 [Strongyloides ratti]